MPVNALLSLLQLSDPTLPIGGFSHSAGLETYVQAGIVHNAETAGIFVQQMLTQNLQYTDAAFVSLAYDAIHEGKPEILFDLDAECTALKMPREIREASQKFGLRLVKIFSDVYPCRQAEAFINALQAKKTSGNYCIVFGLYAFLLNISKTDALTGFFYTSAAGMVTNCVKLVPLGQQDGQRLLFSLQTIISQLVQNTLLPNLEMLGMCCAGFDVRSMQHEQLYSRLYMS